MYVCGYGFSVCFVCCEQSVRCQVMHHIQQKKKGLCTPQQHSTFNKNYIIKTLNLYSTFSFRFLCDNRVN